MSAKATDMKMIFYFHANKTHFHNTQFAFSLILELEMAYCKLLFASPSLIQGFLRACKVDDKKVFQNKLYSSSDQNTFWMYSFLKL